ncbi:Gamma-butyrobetaine dioxygenase [Halocaridina rubra]|uniref:Gamma-butyrobetaine dioxygenase n=1 Tax=Halocaridina rubra TaxID=373956 RepID=A0AAN9A522_HALRR
MKGKPVTVGIFFISFYSLNRDGSINHIVFNQSTRDSVFNVPLEDVKDWYDAMMTLGQLLYHPDNVIAYKMAGGDALVFDNSRVMHGRKAYHMNKGKRELEGCSWDWDMVRSCRRVLQERLDIE